METKSELNTVNKYIINTANIIKLNIYWNNHCFHKCSTSLDAKNNPPSFNRKCKKMWMNNFHHSWPQWQSYFIESSNIFRSCIVLVVLKMSACFIWIKKTSTIKLNSNILQFSICYKKCFLINFTDGKFSASSRRFHKYNLLQRISFVERTKLVCSNDRFKIGVENQKEFF